MAQLLSALPVGAKVKDPNTKYSGKPIIFQVAAKGHSGYPGNSVTLLTEKIISLKAFDAIEAGNSVSNRRSYGNNRYAHSNIRQWLNSAAASWYAAQHSADAPPSSANVWTNHNPYNTEAGFLTNFSQRFRDALLTTSLTVAKNTVTDGGGSEVVSDKVFLLSNTEVGLANENSVAEGSRLALFSAGTDASRIAYPTAEAVTASTYKDTTNLLASKPWYYWLRTPYASYSLSARGVNSSGALDYGYAYYGYYGVRPALNLPSSISVSDTVDADGAYVISFTSPPTVTLTEEDNRTLYENDQLNLIGQAKDVDAGDVVTIKYSIDNGTTRTINAAVSDGSTPIGYNKILKFTNGKLLDGATQITGDLAEGTAHTLRVWAEDDKGSVSAVQTRQFYVVLNRPPAIQVDEISSLAGLTEVDSITVRATVSDLDNNNVTLKYRLNDGQLTEVYSGAPGVVTFEIPVATLVDGYNTLMLQAVDSYNFQSQKTYKINRTFNGADLSTSVARYKLNPATGIAAGVVAWIERNTAANVTAAISIVDENAAENFETMELSNTVELLGGITEDEFSHIAAAARANLAIKIVTNGDVSKISGAFQE